MTGRAVPRRVVVVGAGVVGSSAAARIAERGSDVVLLSAAAAGSTPASRASFAWVNAHAKNPEEYRRLNADARLVHAERSAAHPTPWFHRVGAEIDGVEYLDDGYVDTSAFLAAQLDNLRRAGGVLRDRTTVASLDEVRTVFDPDLIVVAAGIGTAALLGDGGGPRLGSAAGDDGFLVRIRVDEPRIDRIRSRGGLQVRPDGPDRIAAQSLTIEAELRRAGEVATVDAVWPALRREIAATFGLGFPSDAPVHLAHAVRPHAADGLPLIGRVADDVYAAVTHSGITLAPLLAELIARDIDDDVDPRLTPFRP